MRDLHKGEKGTSYDNYYFYFSYVQDNFSSLSQKLKNMLHGTNKNSFYSKLSKTSCFSFQRINQYLQRVRKPHFSHSHFRATGITYNNISNLTNALSIKCIYKVYLCMKSSLFHNRQINHWFHIYIIISSSIHDSVYQWALSLSIKNSSNHLIKLKKKENFYLVATMVPNHNREKVDFKIIQF